jgi:OPT family oligopeptide transporter
MAIPQLTPEEVRTWTVQQKDEWWLKNVFRGDMPQLTLRSAITGMVLGGLLSISNLYVGIRTGWTLGVGITSVIMAFAAFKVLSAIGLGRDLTILENNAMQSIATSAGYMTTPLVASLPAYMLVSGRVIPWWQVVLWSVCIVIVGAMFAFPLKRRFINEEQLPFPEGYAAGVVMDGLHTGSGAAGLFKAKALLIAGGISAFIEILRSEGLMRKVFRLPFHLVEYWDDLLYRFVTPRLAGIPLKDLNFRLDTSIVMLGTGGLMGVKAGASLLVGAILNYLVLAPIMMKAGIIHGPGFREITKWGLWWGVAMMTTASLFSFLSKPEILVAPFRGLLRRKAPAGHPGASVGAAAAAPSTDPLAHIELPLKVSVVGVLLAGGAMVAMASAFFGVTWWMGVIAIPLVFVFSVIAVTSTGLTATTPGGAMGKLTQLTFGAIAPGNMTTNLISAGITSEVSLSASNLLMDIKPGYMLGAKPRQQVVGHILGAIAGSLVVVPFFYRFLFQGQIAKLTSEDLPMPGAQVWRAVAEILAKGFSSIEPTAVWGMLIAGVLGIALEAWNRFGKRGFPISPVAMGLAAVVPFTSSLYMSVGALLFWYMGRRMRDPSTTRHKIWVENRETVCAGVIAGGAFFGTIIAALENTVLK